MICPAKGSLEITSRFIPGQYKQDDGCKDKTSILSRPELVLSGVEGRSGGRIEGCGERGEPW
jgi:hypothetical protein